MDFYLHVSCDTLEDVRYTTDGCASTHECAATVAKFATGKRVEEAMRVSPAMVLDELGERLASDHRHCAILAVSTFLKAVADHLLQP